MVKVKIYNDKYIPGVGRGPFIDPPVEISEETYRLLKIIGITMVKVEESKLETIGSNEEVDETPVEEEVETVEEVVEEATTEAEDTVEEVDETPVEEEVETVEEVVEEATTEAEDTVEEVDYTKMSNNELKKILAANNVKYGSTEKKDSLIEKVKALNL